MMAPVIQDPFCLKCLWHLNSVEWIKSLAGGFQFVFLLYDPVDSLHSWWVLLSQQLKLMRKSWFLWHNQTLSSAYLPGETRIGRFSSFFNSHYFYFAGYLIVIFQSSSPNLKVYFFLAAGILCVSCDRKGWITIFCLPLLIHALQRAWIWLILKFYLFIYFLLLSLCHCSLAFSNCSLRGCSSPAMQLRQCSGFSWCKHELRST